MKLFLCLLFIHLVLGRCNSPDDCDSGKLCCVKDGRNSGRCRNTCRDNENPLLGATTVTTVTPAPTTTTTVGDADTTTPFTFNFVYGRYREFSPLTCEYEEDPTYTVPECTSLQYVGASCTIGYHICKVTIVDGCDDIRFCYNCYRGSYYTQTSGCYGGYY